MVKGRVVLLHCTMMALSIWNNIKGTMEKIYTKSQKECELVNAQPETIQFLLNYSKSLKITEAKGIKFESNLN